MTDLRSGLCHGPDCSWHITARSPSEDFCSDDCQAAWNASHALPPMPVVEVDLPGPSMARWTPEGGAPITPETSTWAPRPSPTDGELVLHDEHRAEGDWPGGKRYGYRCERGLQPRHWTDEERAFAAKWHVSLPTMGMRTHETWWDLPRHKLIEVAASAVTVSWDEPMSPIVENPFTQTTRTARKYGSSRWDGDPLADARRRAAAGEQPPGPEVGEAAAQPPTQNRSWLSRLQGWLRG